MFLWISLYLICFYQLCYVILVILAITLFFYTSFLFDLYYVTFWENVLYTFFNFFFNGTTNILFSYFYFVLFFSYFYLFNLKPFWPTYIFLINSAVVLKHSIVVTNSLLNGLVMIHPLILFFSYCTFLCIILNNSLSTHGHCLRNAKFLLFKRVGIKSILIAIVLGSWWAQQELNWGGWWSWDLVELGSLIFAIFFISLYHTQNYTYIFSFKSSLIFFFFFFFIGIRTNLFLSVHSFINEANQKLFLNYIWALIVLILWLFRSQKSCYTSFFTQVPKVSFICIFTIFFINFLVNFQVHLINTKTLLVFFIILLLSFFSYIFQKSLFTFLYFIQPKFIYVIQFSVSKKKYLHFFIVSFLVVCLLFKTSSIHFNSAFLKYSSLTFFFNEHTYLSLNVSNNNLAPFDFYWSKEKVVTSFNNIFKKQIVFGQSLWIFLSWVLSVIPSLNIISLTPNFFLSIFFWV